jgi:hypothetical protein
MTVERLPDPSLTPTSQHQGAAEGTADAMGAPGGVVEHGRPSTASPEGAPDPGPWTAPGGPWADASPDESAEGGNHPQSPRWRQS